tara:strand:+ start:637 stop:894 length:258 start_codon:yes stop_codon:yes gene_type:complete
MIATFVGEPESTPLSIPTANLTANNVSTINNIVAKRLTCQNCLLRSTSSLKTCSIEDFLANLASLLVDTLNALLRCEQRYTEAAA